MNRPTYSKIGRGFAGWHAAGLVDCIGRPSVTSSSGGTLDGYLAEAAEGALVYDAAHLELDAERARAYRVHVIGGPMYDPECKPRQVKRFGAGWPIPFEEIDPSIPAALDSLGSLDYVGADVMRALLSRVPGVRLGRVVAGRVEWSNDPTCAACGEPMTGLDADGDPCPDCDTRLSCHACGGDDASLCDGPAEQRATEDA